MRGARALFALWALGALPSPAAEPAVRPAAPALRFADGTLDAGIDFVLTSGASPSREILEVNGGGVALFDYDQDGDLDVFFANGATMADPEHGPGSRLYANDGRGRFTDVTAKVGISLRRWAMGVATGDVDSDGDDDLFVTCYGPDVLLRNDASPGGRRFTDVTAASGLGDPRWGASAAFSDLDLDGDLDLYVTNYLVFDPAKPPPRRTFKGAPVFGGPLGMEAPGNALYENLGQGKFRDVTLASGCGAASPSYSMGVVIVDFDQDGKPDLFVGNDSRNDYLFHNLGGLKFKEIGVAAGVATNYDGRAQATMGIAVGDVDGNGFPDLFTTNFSSDTDTLHVNLGRMLFDDRTSQYGLAAVTRPFLSWGTGFYDFDLDGDEDLFIASGHIYPEAADHEIDSDYEQVPLLFARTGARFVRAEDAGEIFRTPYPGRSTAFGDLDQDGDVDIVLTNLNDRVRLFRNDAPERDVVVVELVGRGGNRHGLGARVELTAAGSKARRFVHGGSYQSVDAPEAHFGLGDGTPGPLELRVSWDDGSVTREADVPRNRRIVVRQGGSRIEAFPLAGRNARRMQ